MTRHRTGTARSGPPPDRPPTPAPPTPPAWRNWLLIAGLVLTVVLFLLPVPTARKVEQLSYSQLKSDIAAGQVASVALGADGSVSGKLTNGTRFTSSFPTSLQDPQFAQLLDDHNVQVTTQAAGTSIWSVLLNLLPLAIIVGLFVWSGRATRRQLAGMGGLGGIARARSRVFAEATQRLIDEEVAKLLREAEQRATGLLGAHRDALERLTGLLLERETIDGTDVDEILGRVPGQHQPIGATRRAAATAADGSVTATGRGGR
jgi:ATP-dependent Zn protease